MGSGLSTTATTTSVRSSPFTNSARSGCWRSCRFATPLARWFHDGVANAVAETIIREEISEEAALNTPYSTRHAAQFSPKRASANLPAWARKDIQDYMPLAEETACYYFATEEIRGLEARHGKGSLRQLLTRLREFKPVTSEVIWVTVKDLWEEDLQARLSAYSPQLPFGVAMKRVAAVNQERWPDAVSLLRQSVESEPRDLQLRYMLVGSLLSLDPEKNLSDVLFHGRAYWGLAQAMGKEPEMFWAAKHDAKTYWALGKFGLALGSPVTAKEYFRLALKENPNHAASLEALRDLEKAGSK